MRLGSQRGCNPRACALVRFDSESAHQFMGRLCPSGLSLWATLDGCTPHQCCGVENEKLAGLISRRLKVRILPPLPTCRRLVPGGLS